MPKPITHEQKSLKGVTLAISHFQGTQNILVAHRISHPVLRHATSHGSRQLYVSREYKLMKIIVLPYVQDDFCLSGKFATFNDFYSLNDIYVCDFPNVSTSLEVHFIS